MSRVLKNGGMVMILEFTKPAGKIFGKIYELYFFRILPLVGKMISGDPSAYKYLPESVYNFPPEEDFVRMMNEAGFSDIHYTSFTRGIVTFYRGLKIEQ